ncbi:MAG: methionine gamma-lyase family protein [Anaerovoracaceae bacterium]|nr:methionine gamma-lyase family protein [Anaerovoracaceae bacterium]
MDKKEILLNRYNIDPRAIDAVYSAENQLKSQFAEYDAMAEINQLKVLGAMQEHRLSDMHFNWNTGYGYDDSGREITEKIFATAFGGEASLVRTGFVNGTHALATCLAGILRPKDHLIYCTGKPYDTLEEVIGTRGAGMGSLMEFGITYDQVELTENAQFDFEKIKEKIKAETKVVGIQRATGYGFRPSISMEQIAEFVKFIKAISKDIIVFVDNCYGEFLDTKEPLEVGCDVMAGSLIKNPCGGLALSGGYVCGRKDIVDMVSYRLTCPGIGDECGLTYGQTRNILQGLFIAPKVAVNAIKGAALCGLVYEKMGFDVCPKTGELRSDIIQAITLGSRERLISFCKGVQNAAPVDSFVSPEPWPMPGYDCNVVMAAGAFVQGSSIELSADGPAREPFNVYFQGGLTYEHSKFGVLKSLDQLYKDGLL